MLRPGATLKWIDPCTKLPDSYQHVLVCTDPATWGHFEYDMAYLAYDKELWITDSGYSYEPEEIGWWTEFPPLIGDP